MFEESSDQRDPDGWAPREPRPPGQAKPATTTGIPSRPADTHAPTNASAALDTPTPAHHTSATAPTDPDPSGWDVDPATLVALAARWCDHDDPPDPVDAGDLPGWAGPADPWPDGWLTPPPGLPAGVATLDPDLDPAVVAASFRPHEALAGVLAGAAELTLATWRPSGWLALDLDAATAHPGSMSDTLLIDAVVGWEHLISWATARQMRVLAEFGRRRPDDPHAVMSSQVCAGSDRGPDEVALALQLSRGAAGNQLGRAGGYTDTLTDTLGLLEQGRLDRARAHAICDAVAFHTPQTALAVQARVLPAAPGQTLAQLRAALWRAVIAVDPRGAEQRHRAARQQRRVTLSGRDDGMASLWALLAAPDAIASYEWLTRLARSLGKHDPRPMDARRADLLVDLLTGRLELHDTDHTDTEDTDDTDDTDTEITGGEDTDREDTDREDTGGETANPDTERAATRSTDTKGDETEGTGETGTGKTTTAEPDLVEPDLVEPDLVEPDLVEPDLVQPDPVEPDPVQPDPVEPDPVEPDLAEPDPAEPEVAGPEAAGPQVAGPDLVEVAGPCDSDADGPGQDGPGQGRRKRKKKPRRGCGKRPTRAGKPLVHIIVPYSTLTGADNQPCELAGYGPIPADLARTIAADAVWKRLITDPLSGTVLDHGRDTYRPPLALAEFVRARDLHCRMPGCQRHANNCELDHTIDWAKGGTTTDTNLYTGCLHDHRIKDRPGWTVTQTPDGRVEWTTPTGHRYSSHPHDYRPDNDPDPPLLHHPPTPEPLPEQLPGTDERTTAADAKTDTDQDRSSGRQTRKRPWPSRSFDTTLFGPRSAHPAPPPEDGQNDMPPF